MTLAKTSARRPAAPGKVRLERKVPLLGPTGFHTPVGLRSTALCFQSPFISPQYVHVLDKSKFVHEPGLGVMEMISRDPSANLGRLDLNRRAAIDELVKSGSVIVEWKAAPPKS